MNERNIEILRRAGFTIEPGRLRRAQKLTPERWSPLPQQDGFQGVFHSGGQRRTTYRPVIRTHATFIDLNCDCVDWRTRGMHQRMPCKHLLSLALHVGDIPTISDAPKTGVADTDTPEPRPSEPPFGQRVREAIADAIARLADRVDDLLTAEEIPFLLGPTGSGKTSAVRQVAARRGWAFEEVAGSPSFADSDLVGLRTDHMEVPGVFARAFARARDGQPVLLFIDEATRFNARAMDILMRPLQITPAAIARAMGLAWSDIRLVEAPLWGQDWAPAENVHIVLAANPWGAQLDPALVRRARPLEVRFTARVLDLFDEPVRGAIQASWSAVDNGQLALPMEYQLLASARGPDDQALFPPYLARLRALDRAAAEGFETILAGLGIDLGGAA